MESEIIWITPLLMLPGIATLIISTANRYSTLHDEIHRWLDNPQDAVSVGQAHLVERAVHFRNALVAQYISVFVFICASLFGFALDILNINGEALVLFVLFVGILVIGYSALELIRESRFSLAAIRSHIGQLVKSEDSSHAKHS